MLEDIEQLSYEYYSLDMIDDNLYGKLTHAMKEWHLFYLPCKDYMSKTIYDKHKSYINKFCKLRELDGCYWCIDELYKQVKLG